MEVISANGEKSKIDRYGPLTLSNLMLYNDKQVQEND